MLCVGIWLKEGTDDGLSLVNTHSWCQFQQFIYHGFVHIETCKSNHATIHSFTFQRSADKVKRIAAEGAFFISNKFSKGPQLVEQLRPLLLVLGQIGIRHGLPGCVASNSPIGPVKRPSLHQISGDPGQQLLVPFFKILGCEDHLIPAVVGSADKHPTQNFAVMGRIIQQFGNLVMCRVEFLATQRPQRKICFYIVVALIVFLSLGFVR